MLVQGNGSRCGAGGLVITDAVGGWCHGSEYHWEAGGVRGSEGKTSNFPSFVHALPSSLVPAAAHEGVGWQPH